MSGKESQEETLFKNKDVRLLRERLAWVHKISPPFIQQHVNETLAKFALSVREYCKCEERVYIKLENKNACLNCGERTEYVPAVKR